MSTALSEFQIYVARNSRSPYEFAERLKLRFVERGRGRYCLNRLINKRCAAFSWQQPYLRHCVCENSLNGFGIDHPFAFRYPADPSLPFACFVWFPYDLKEAVYGDPTLRLAKWCDVHSCEFKTFEKNTGWYGYGSYMVCVWRNWNIKRKITADQMLRAIEEDNATKGENHG